MEPVALEANSHTGQNGSLLAKWVTLSHLKLLITLSKMGHFWQNGSNLKEWVTLYKDGSHSSKLSHLKVWVTLGKMGDMRPMGHTWENE